MFVDEFSPVATLARETCPRCKGHGLVPATREDCDNVSPEDRARLSCVVCPSLDAKCPVCGLVGEWPAMCMEPEATV